EGKGAVHSYTEVHHAIQPSFRAKTPYMVLLVDLDTQKGEPTPDEALRVIGNLCTPDGQLAPPDIVKRVGVGTRVRMVFSDVSEGIALPQWTIDETAQQPAKVWRYAQEKACRRCGWVLRTSRVFRHKPIAAGPALRCV